jgi:hypothetical protein
MFHNIVCFSKLKQFAKTYYIVKQREYIVMVQKESRMSWNFVRKNDFRSSEIESKPNSNYMEIR